MSVNVGNRNLSTAPLASPRPPSTTARIAPAQRAAHEPTGTLHRHAACSPASRLPPPTAARAVQHVGVPRIGVSTSNPHHAPQSMSPRIVPRRVWRVARCGHEPRSPFACPRLSASPIQPCPSPFTYVAPHRSIEAGGFQPGAAAGATQRPRSSLSQVLIMPSPGQSGIVRFR